MLALNDQKKNEDSDDVRHYKVKYEKQHAGQPQNECWEKYRICKKDEYSHIKWSPQIKMDSSKKTLEKAKASSQHSCTKKERKYPQSFKIELMKFRLTKVHIFSIP